MVRKVYLETSIVSYLTARPSRDLVMAARQHLTREWWESHRREYDLYVSGIVLRESGEGDEEAASVRLSALEGLPELDLTEESYALAAKLIQEVPLPETAGMDALHIAVAVVNGMDYLLTWNCRHIANATHRSRIEEVCRRGGFEPPTICTPEEFMEE